ncbi:aldose 1-epimerase-like [Strongylocentrotus purpuratus]|uniref:Galactose mutarotase n=1 Tax=Strongylocentrotus purpuratus TaxID=7668 RepID=A0A7M7PR52_STRPU|nr:aldose 1-epimerase-like [Strongylocentrotus purpuratus]
MGSTDRMAAQGYETNAPSFGVTIGRVVNRIAKGQFALDGVHYQLEINDGSNHIHGGVINFSHRLWEGHIEETGVSFSYTSPDGENGYPGEVFVTINYQLTDDNKLLISYVAKTTKATPINLTNHSYFNLGGHDSGSVTDHIVEIDADKYTPMVIETTIPSGEISSVDDTVFDLRSPTRIGDKINEVPGLGYDHNFCVKSSEKPCVMYVKHVTHKESGRKMEVSTTKPGIQFYTANYLNDSTVGKCGAIYPKHSALCLESQFYPNAVNQPNFPSCILQPGDMYTHLTAFAFSWN